MSIRKPLKVNMFPTQEAPAKFAVGDSVRVRIGVTDPDFPDIPLGGRVGKIAEIEDADTPFISFAGARRR